MSRLPLSSWCALRSLVSVPLVPSRWNTVLTKPQLFCRMYLELRRSHRSITAAMVPSEANITQFNIVSSLLLLHLPQRPLLPGLRLSDVAPRGSSLRSMVQLQEDHFYSYRSFLVTTNVSYADVQAELLQVQDRLQALPWVSDSMRVRDLAWISDGALSLLASASLTPTTPLPPADFYTALRAWASTSGAPSQVRVRLVDLTLQRSCERRTPLPAVIW
jgi:hypothetical protein